MNMATIDAFLTYWALGYKRLVPIIPPSAEISPGSTLFKRVGTHQDGRGKTPGVKGKDGLWHSFDWVPHEADEHDLRRWQGMRAGVGIKTGQQGGFTLLAIDADTLDADCARTIRDIVEKHCGRLPVRVGKYPKAIYVCRIDAPFRYCRVEFGERNERGLLPNRVEILSDGRQFVAHGIHPGTKLPYEWPRDLVPFDELPTFTPAEIDALMAELQRALPKAAPLVREGASSDINQESLRGRLEHVAKAVAALPNTSDLYPTRESYLAVGYAIKAALPDDESGAFGLFQDWCERWSGGVNEPEIVEADWRRMKAPFKRGAGWLYEQAEQHGGGAFTAADLWFDDIDAAAADNPFAEIAQREASAAAAQRSDVYPLLTVAELMTRPPPAWLVQRHFPRQGVGFLYGAPGARKSFIAQDLGLSVACSLPTWHGDAIDAGEAPAVVYIAAEGSFDIGERVKAWLNRRGLSADQAKSFLVLEQTVNFMAAADVGKLLRTLRGIGPLRPVLTIVDTVSRALPGADENLQKDMTVFVRACDAVRDAFGGLVLGIHHASKEGDMRGSTVLRGAGDFVFSLSRKEGAPVGLLKCEKMKAAPDGWSDPYRFDVVSLGGDRSSLVVERMDVAAAADVELTPELSASVLGAMRTAWNEGEPWSRAPQSGDRYAVRRMVAEFGFDADKAEELLTLWVQTGVVTTALTSSTSKRKGLKVLSEPVQDVPQDSIFD